MQEQTGEPIKKKKEEGVKGKWGRVRPVCCVCIPLRLGVFLNAVFTIISSTFMVIFKKEFEDSTRTVSGGYCLLSRTIIFFIEVTGTFWGICGIIGAWRCQWSYVRLYNIYQWARLLAWVLMYITDVPLLWYCELWISDIDGAHAKMGWNPIVYSIAFHGRCARERTDFFIGSTLGFCLFLYLTLANQRYQTELAVSLPYFVSASKDKPKGTFFSQSLGERSFLLDAESQPPKNPSYV